MDEISCLKYIFKDLQISESKEVVIQFNGNIYSFGTEKESINGFKSIYDYILAKESSSEMKKNESSKEIESSNIEIAKITEEQFLEWKRMHQKQKKKEELTGKIIWKQMNSEDIYE